MGSEIFSGSRAAEVKAPHDRAELRLRAVRGYEILPSLTQVLIYQRFAVSTNFATIPNRIDGSHGPEVAQVKQLT